MLVLVALIAAPQVMRAWKYDPNTPENAAYYSTSLETKLTYGLFYLTIAGFTAVMSYDVHEMLANVRVR